MAYCQKCGAQLLDTAAFCGSCGTPVGGSWRIEPAPTAHRPEPTAPLAAERPPVVTFACAASIILGAIGVATGVAVLFWVLFMGALFAQMFSWIPVVGWWFGIFGSFAVAFLSFWGVLFLAWGILGIVAGSAGFRGETWARWTMIAMFGVGLVVSSGGAVLGIVGILLNAGGIVALVMKDANDWFEGRHRARTLI